VEKAGLKKRTSGKQVLGGCAVPGKKKQRKQSDLETEGKVVPTQGGRKTRMWEGQTSHRFQRKRGR